MFSMSSVQHGVKPEAATVLAQASHVAWKTSPHLIFTFPPININLFTNTQRPVLPVFAAFCPWTVRSRWSTLQDTLAQALQAFCTG